MPLTLLVALFLAFGLDARPSTTAFLTWTEVSWRAVGVLSTIALLAVLARSLGWWVGRGVERRGYVPSSLRRVYIWGTRAVAAFGLGFYACVLYFLSWSDVVRSVLGGRDWPIASDALLLLPFLLTEVAAWWGLYAAERALRVARTGESVGLKRYLVLKGRQVAGLLLPVFLVYSLGQDLANRYLPSATAAPWAQPAGLALMAALVLVASPLFLRLAWPTRPLAPGPLRDRLESLARRVGFRCTDILVWDTGNVLVNAGVTGTLPWFRYVFLSDALVENLPQQEVAAVFGHEIGHIAHRHLQSFGLFFLGTIGVMAVINGALDQYVLAGVTPVLVQRYANLGSVLETTAGLLVLGVYFFVAFGLVSRRFERQADLFGCRAVSCGRAECPPHRDVDGLSERSPAQAAAVCPAGIRTFVSALTNVAALNGMGRDKPSWRHGSIARRVAFLESLEGRPDVERRFQRGVTALRGAIVLMLSLAWWWAWAENWIQKP
ncbi:MAG: M48 family metallopeptidase [Isosphaeraceae bacterium]|nr:M48 family metallopeptidase [Isosphaeraceae bacterium]